MTLPHLVHPLHVKIESIPSQLWYLLSFSSVACVYPYLPVFFRRIGFNESQIGYLNAIRPLVRAPSGYFLATFADVTASH